MITHEGPDFSQTLDYLKKMDMKWLAWFAGVPTLGPMDPNLKYRYGYSQGLMNSKAGAWGDFQWRTDGVGRFSFAGDKIDLVNRSPPQPRESVDFEYPDILVDGVRGPVRRELAVPFTCHGFEVVLSTMASGQLIHLANHAGISTVTQLLACSVAGLPRLFKRHLWVDAKRQGLLLAGKPIGKAPIFAAPGIDEQEHSAAVRELIWLLFGLGILDGNRR